MKLLNVDPNQLHATASNFKFSAIEIEKLGGSEYTIVQIVVDESGSVGSFKNDLEKMLKTVADACKKSPRAENLLMRVTTFNNSDVNEVHGFTLLNTITNTQYDGIINPNGSTPLYDATLNALESLEVYGKSLKSQDFLANSIMFVITDGCENSSRNGDVNRIKHTIQSLRKNEVLESIRTILIGVDDQSVRSELDAFKNNAGLDEYISMGDVTSGKLAKLAAFVSKSISSTSQSLGTGAASTPVDFTI